MSGVEAAAREANENPVTQSHRQHPGSVPSIYILHKLLASLSGKTVDLGELHLLSTQKQLFEINYKLLEELDPLSEVWSHFYEARSWDQSLLRRNGDFCLFCLSVLKENKDYF